MDVIITILPMVTKDLPISPRFTPYNFLSRCKFSTLTTRQPMVEFYCCRKMVFDEFAGVVAIPARVPTRSFGEEMSPPWFDPMPTSK